METKKILEEELKKVEKWEKEQYDDGLIAKIQRMPFKLLDKITPKFIHEKIEQATNEMLNFLNDEKNILVNKKMIMEEYKDVIKREIELDEIKNMNINSMSEVADNIINKRKKASFYQGATTGFGGAFTLVVDIPLVLTNALKTIQEVGLSYGYEQNAIKEKIYAVKVLQFTASDVVGKKKLSKELTHYGVYDGKEAISTVKGWREVFQNFRDSYGWKKLLQTVPVVGIVFGAFVNKSYIEDIGEAANMFYKKRKITERLK